MIDNSKNGDVSPQVMKEAGLLKAPPMMLKEITEWANGVIAGKVMDNVRELLQTDAAGLNEAIDKTWTQIRQLEDARTSLRNVTERVGLDQQPQEIIFSEDSLWGCRYEVRTDFDKHDRENWEDSTFKVNLMSQDERIVRNGLTLDECYKIMYAFEGKWSSKMEVELDRITTKSDELGTKARGLENLVELHLLLRECKKYSIIKSYGSQVGKIFKYSDYSNEPLLQHFEVRLLIFFYAQDADAAYKTPEEDGWSGLWKADNRLGGKYNDIWVKCDPSGIYNVATFNERLSELNSVIRHELQHLSQDAMQLQKGLSEIGGLPGRKQRNKGTDASGTPAQSDGYRIEHALRDVEFYTNLSDSVERFILVWGDHPEDTKLTAAMSWVGMSMLGNDRLFRIPNVEIRKSIVMRGPNSMFRTLQKEAPLKWKKAVKEFFKAIFNTDISAAVTATAMGESMNRYGKTKGHAEHLDVIKSVIERIKSSDTVKQMFAESGVKIDLIDLVPMRFDDIDVSATTDHGIISFSNELQDTPEEIDHYMVHELKHVLQQCFGEKPTKGSTDDNYLDNKYEQEGFQEQTRYLSETRDDDAAEAYIEKVLDHHDTPKKEREDRRKDLLDLASLQWYLKKANRPKMSR